MRQQLKGRPAKYPWRNIEVGQSFFAPGRTPTSIMNDARRFHAPKKFKSRSMIASGVQGVRVWRIA